MSIKIITDSSSDIPTNIGNLLDIEIIPLSITLGENTYLDGVDITPDELYQQMKTNHILPKTSQPSPEKFSDAFKKALEENDEVIVILISSKFSGTFQAATLAKNNLKSDNIHIIDSETVSLGLGLLVREAVKMRDKNLSSLKIISRIKAFKSKLRFYALIDDLKYLKIGGRLSSAGALIATALNIKPIISVKAGEAKTIAKVRGRQQAYNKFLDLMLSEIYDSSLLFAYGHAGALERMMELKATIEKSVNVIDAVKGEIGSTIASHSGPGCTGIAFFVK